ncbi:glycosyltransferase family 2 protein [Leptolyngbya sp. AN02str]|uniref:glycosyltransferase family 2 protein n=1 Tax=Leptolyngbya sp. AN02str TaxID=3423363 RepID=UPI003D31FCBF
MPQITVVIPAYNAMRYLPAAVDSVLNQTFTDFEILIVDDGSSDQVRSWASQLSDPRIRLISQPNQGLSGARNTGILQAQGDYVAFLDADDLWAPSKLEKQLRQFQERPELGLVHTWMEFIDESGKSTGRVMKSFAEGDTWNVLAERNVIACPSVIVRRSCFDQVGMFDCQLRSLEDWDMWIRIAAQFPFAVVPEPLAYYRQTPGSMSKNCVVMEQSFYIVIDKTFAQAPAELLPLKNRSLGHANLCLAWKALQSQERDDHLAALYQQKAVQVSPRLRLSREYLRLKVAIAMMQGLGNHRYDQALSLFYRFRRYLSKVSKTAST